MRKAFTFLELIFVVVVVGILAKFGANIMATAYQTSASTFTNNKLTVDTELTIQQLANRLQYRIKDSVIARVGNTNTFDGINDLNGTRNYTVLEWIGYDIDGWHGTHNGTFNAPAWSGFIDVNDPTALATRTFLDSPGTETNTSSAIIQAVNSSAAGGTNFTNAAIFFTGANSDVQNDYGWNTTINVNNQSNFAAHRVTTNANIFRLVSNAGADFNNTDIYENYKLAWTAYAVRIADADGDGDNDLLLSYDYQPWEGESWANGSSALLLENVDTFLFQGVGDTLRLQVCVNDNNNSLGGGLYAICKETAIF